MPSLSDAPPEVSRAYPSRSDAASKGRKCANCELFNCVTETVEDLFVDIVSHCAVEIPGVHTFRDDRQPERRKGDKVGNIAHITTGSSCVSLNQLLIRGKSSGARWVVLALTIAVRVGPIHAEVSKVSQRVTEGAELPVEHCGNTIAIEVGEAVSKSVIAVSDRNRMLLRN